MKPDYLKINYPEVFISDESVPPTVNNAQLAHRLRKVWVSTMGKENVLSRDPKGMGAEDYPFFTTDPYIPSVYFGIGGTPNKYFDAADEGGEAVPSHHSPLFKIEPESSVTTGVEATVLALLELMPK